MTTETTSKKPSFTEMFRQFIARDGVCVLDTHGQIDVSATLDRLATELATHQTENALDQGKAAEIINGLFNELGEAKRKTIEIDLLAFKATMKMSPPVGTETKVKRMFQNFVRGESKVFESSNGTKGLYHVRRGAGRGAITGGVNLATEAYRADFAKSQAEKKAKNDNNGVVEID